MGIYTLQSSEKMHIFTFSKEMFSLQFAFEYVFFKNWNGQKMTLEKYNFLVMYAQSMFTYGFSK